MIARFMRYRLVLTAAAALGLAAVAQPAAAAEWKFALEEIEGSVQHAYATEFKKRIEEKSGGDVTVQIYPYGALGTSANLTEMTTAGAVQITNASPGHLGQLIPEIQVFSIPYLLSQDNSVNKDVLTDNECIYGKLSDNFEDKDLKLLTMYPEGEMVWTANREITKPEDFDNFKMRTMTSPLLVTAYEAFGASPSPMPYGEVYGGLQLGQIDGQVNPIFAIEEMKFYEVQDYMIWAGQQQFTTTVVSNRDWYEGLSDEHQTMVDETIADMADYIFELQDEYNQERLEQIKEDKPDLEMIRLTEEQRQPFVEASQEVREQFVDMVGDEGAEVLECLSEQFGSA